MNPKKLIWKSRRKKNKDKMMIHHQVIKIIKMIWVNVVRVLICCQLLKLKKHILMYFNEYDNNYTTYYKVSNHILMNF